MTTSSVGTAATEIAIFPNSAVLNEQKFLWRLSSSHMSKDGKFSEFPGYDRYLSVTKGEDLKLQYEKSGEVRRLPRRYPCQSAGGTRNAQGSQ